MSGNMKREQTCCFTGHRTIPRADLERVREATRREITRLYGQGVRYFGAGGALGFDTIAAETVLDLRAGECPDIRLILVLPCRDQADRWRAADQRRYAEILGVADKVVYTAESYCDGCMQKRNRHLVDCSGYCIAYLTRSWGGTAYTVRYAQSAGVEVTVVP